MERRVPELVWNEATGEMTVTFVTDTSQVDTDEMSPEELALWKKKQELDYRLRSEMLPVGGWGGRCYA
jgi:hypothetical protein